MSTNIVKGMAIAGWHKGDPALQNHLQCFPETQAEEEAKMRAALLWLADNVSDEMVYAYLFAPHISGKNVDENVRQSIAAALRAAAGSALEAKP